MKHLNTKLYIWALIIISLIIYGVYFAFSSSYVEYENFLDFLKPLSFVVIVDAFIVSIFVKWLWKLKLFYPWFVPFPDLNGTWKGVLKSNWKCPNTGKKPNEIPTILTINQTFTNVSCVMRTGELCSESFTSGFIINLETDSTHIVYSYKSDPKADIKYRSAPHFGTAKLSVVNNQLILDGEYWSSRETTGTIHLKFWKKEKLDIYLDEFGEHPMSTLDK